MNMNMKGNRLQFVQNCVEMTQVWFQEHVHKTGKYKVIIYIKINKFRTDLISDKLLLRFYKEFVWQAKEIVRK